ncbi:ABC transporter permease [Fodinicola acaciae]|uniref:ABC transporter permease n=1 Tax=Fodinicola acaciae TaxID=2681555 RepID=UPI0013D59C83|nr:ABC transporter permease [Fodinicola acaciae]
MTAALSRLLYRKPLVRLGSLLSLPLLWLVVAYLGSLAAMFLTAFWTVDSFTGNLVPGFSLGNFAGLVSDAIYRTVAARSLGVAVLVTMIDAVIALPLAFFMAKVASPRAQRFLVAAVLTPLWASYLVKAYAWRVMLGGSGVFDWMIGGGGQSYYGLSATTITLAYLWLPYMILPVYAGLERIPDSLLEASSDLGASAWRTFRSVVLPLLFPAVVAGSIFTFSLTLGDYITVKIVGGKSQLFANIIYDNVVTADNLPFAAAAGLFPVVVMLVYLAAVRRSGALDNL